MSSSRFSFITFWPNLLSHLDAFNYGERPLVNAPLQLHNGSDYFCSCVAVVEDYTYFLTLILHDVTAFEVWFLHDTPALWSSAAGQSCVIRARAPVPPNIYIRTHTYTI